MEELWPAPTPEGAAVIRSVCRHLMTRLDEILDEVSEPSLTAQHEDALMADASLSREDREANRSDLTQWLTSNIQAPGRPVAVYFESRTAAYFADLASRGIEPDFTDGWRVGLGIFWRSWLAECLARCDDPAVLTDVLGLVPQSMAQYTLDWFTALREAVVANAVSATEAEVIETIQLIAGGAPIPQDFAESRLSYRLARWHRALVLWVEDLQHVDVLDDIVAGLRTAAGGRHALIARASTTSRWVWLSGSSADDLPTVESMVAETEHVQTTLGRPGQGLAGFRSSHQDALAAQAMVVRLGSQRPLTAYADVELIDALTKDRGGVKRFVVSTLGALADADHEVREALLTYIQCGFNTTRAAARLYAHRNTIERRVSRANELATVKMEDKPAQLASALLVLDIAPDIVTTTR